MKSASMNEDEDGDVRDDREQVVADHDPNQPTEILVLPADADRAREIIREISGSEPL